MVKREPGVLRDRGLRGGNDSKFGVFESITGCWSL